MTEAGFDTLAPSLGSEDWQFITDEFEWFFGPEEPSSAPTAPGWEKDSHHYRLGRNHDAGYAHYVVAKSDLDGEHVDVFQIIPKTHTIMVTIGFQQNSQDSHSPNLADIAALEEIVGTLRSQRSDFVQWQTEIWPEDTVAPPPPTAETGAKQANDLFQIYLGSVATFWQSWSATVYSFWGIPKK